MPAWAQSCRGRALAALAACLTLAACATNPQGGASLEMSLAKPSTPTTVPVSGRLSIRVHEPATGRRDGGSMLFEIEGDPDQGQLSLRTPLGTSLASVRWSPAGAESLSSQGRHTGAHLDDLAGAITGQALPLAALMQWIQARPWPREPHLPLPDGFEQMGWRISLSAWDQGVITARRPARPGVAGDLEIVVVARLDTASAASPVASPGAIRP